MSSSPKGHKFEGLHNTILPTCNEDGYTYNTCSQCNEKNKFNVQQKLGHYYLEIITPAECEVAGTKKCSNCTSTIPIPATGHVYKTTYK